MERLFLQPGPESGIIALVQLKPFPAELHIGKRPNPINDLHLPGNTISREHAMIYRDHRTGKAYLVDLDSLNGTYVNNRKISPNQECGLSAGDTICFANEPQWSFQVLAEDRGEATPAAPLPLETGETICGSRNPRACLRVVSGPYVDTPVPLLQRGAIIGGPKLPKEDGWAACLLKQESGIPDRLVEVRWLENRTVQLGALHPDVKMDVEMLVDGETVVSPVLLRDGAVISFRQWPRFRICFSHALQRRIPVVDIAEVSLAGARGYRIGRASNTNELTLRDATVSLEHATILATRDGPEIRNRKSFATTFVNGIQVEQQRLYHNDLILLGDVPIQFRDSDSFQIPAARRAYLKVEKVCRRINDNFSLRDISFDLGPGDLVGLLGHQACGKSALSGLFLGKNRADSGRVLLNGVDMAGRSSIPDATRKLIAEVAQTMKYDRTMRVWDHLEHEAKVALPNLKQDERKMRIEECLRVCQAAGIAHKLIEVLSGGESKLLALAEILLNGATFLYLDEPNSAVSPDYDKMIFDLLRQQARTGCTVIVTTHRHGNIERLTKVLYLCQGRVLYFGPQYYFCPFFDVDRAEDVYEKFGAETTREALDRAVERFQEWKTRLDAPNH